MLAGWGVWVDRRFLRSGDIVRGVVGGEKEKDECEGVLLRGLRSLCYVRGARASGVELTVRVAVSEANYGSKRTVPGIGWRRCLLNWSVRIYYRHWTPSLLAFGHNGDIERLIKPRSRPRIDSWD